MKVTSVETKEKSTVELTIQVEADAFEAAIQKVYLKTRGRINVPGFRKGKAPRKITPEVLGSRGESRVGPCGCWARLCWQGSPGLESRVERKGLVPQIRPG